MTCRDQAGIGLILLCTCAWSLIRKLLAKSLRTLRVVVKAVCLISLSSVSLLTIEVEWSGIFKDVWYRPTHTAPDCRLTKGVNKPHRVKLRYHFVCPSALLVLLLVKQKIYDLVLYRPVRGPTSECFTRDRISCTLSTRSGAMHLALRLFSMSNGFLFFEIFLLVSRREVAFCSGSWILTLIWHSRPTIMGFSLRCLSRLTRA